MSFAVAFSTSFHESSAARARPLGSRGEERHDGHEPSAVSLEPNLLALVGAVNGVYRSGSDHRKDGHAVGW